MAQRSPTRAALENKVREAKGTATQGDQPATPSPEEAKKKLIDGIGQAIRLSGLLSRAATFVGSPQASEKINAAVQSLTEAQGMVNQAQPQTAPASAGATAPPPAAPPQAQAA